jgi:MFS family permease
MTPGESDSTNTWLPAERRAVGVIALIGMLRMFGLFALLPVLALHAATLEGATPLLIGLAVGAYGLTQAGLQIPLGALSDRIGRVPVIVAGLAVFAAGSILAAYSDSVWGVITGRLLQGAGAISATLTALIADATRDGVRTRSMAVFGVGVGGAFMLAMIFGPKFSGHSWPWLPLSCSSHCPGTFPGPRRQDNGISGRPSGPNSCAWTPTYSCSTRS